MKAQLNEIHKILPKGVELRLYYNQTDFVSDYISSLKYVFWIGLILAIFITVLFLPSPKASSVILVTIPVTFSLTLILLYILNYNFNIMTIGAVAAAIGLIIDDAIVVVEQIHRTHEENPDFDSVNKLNHGFIFLNDGKIKPIDEFADLIVSESVAEMDRENLKPMVSVKARLTNRDLGSTLKEIKEKIQSKIILPPGYHLVYGGAYAEQQQAFKELLSILIAAVLLVFTVILFLFRSLRITFAIIFISDLGISGSLLALFITGTPLNVGSYTGIIMIVGIIGENAIFTYLQYRENRDKNILKEESIVYSISTRLRPKLMTALGAITALFPLALWIGTGAQMHQSLAIAIIGGFILPTILNIIEK